MSTLSKQKREYIKSVALSIHEEMLLINGEAMDGDETEDISKAILKELNNLNANT